MTISPVNQVTMRGEVGRGIRSTGEIEVRKLGLPHWRRHRCGRASSPPPPFARRRSLPRAIKRPGRGYTEGKLQVGMAVVVVVVVVVPRLPWKFCCRMAPVYPSIHVDPRIKESTSCKTANRYYEGRTRRCCTRSRHPGRRYAL